jgi:membrane associated rhomboid family serine protease
MAALENSPPPSLVSLPENPTLRRENLHTLYIILFLNIAFFFLQMQDAERYYQLFAFDADRFLAGEFWRILTFQFVQGGSLFGGPAISLFFTLLILYIMGMPLEEEWGSLNFLAFLLISTVASAGAAWALGLPPVLGSYAFTYSLLFAYASEYPQQSFLIFFVLPVKVTWLAWITLGVAIFGVLRLNPDSIVALAGAAASYSFFLLRRRSAGRPIRFAKPRVAVNTAPAKPPASAEHAADGNLRRFGEMKAALESGEDAKIDALVQGWEGEIVPGVNICPPADYKPENQDRYCIRCEGFAECSARYLKLNRAPAEKTAAASQS